MSAPLVSVVIAAYNAGCYLPETLASVLAQTHRQCEILVVDDGSTDDTPALIAPYLARIRFIQQQHGGLAAARNAAVRLARGDYIALLDADDLWLPEKLAVQLAVAAAVPESGLIICDGEEFAGDVVLCPHLLGAGEFFGLAENEITGQFHQHFMTGNPISCPAQTLLPRHVVAAVGPFSDSAAQDYDYYLRVASRFPVTFHRHRLVRWRYRADSMSGRRERRYFFWRLRTLEVLRMHARRCEGADRVFLEQQRDQMVHDLATRVSLCEDRNYALACLTELFHNYPWHPTALQCLAALQREDAPEVDPPPGVGLGSRG